MKKINLLFISTLIIFISCENNFEEENSIINKPLLKSESRYSAKDNTSQNSKLMNPPVEINFNWGIDSFNSGCTTELLDYQFKLYTYYGVYGSIPRYYNGYNVRGYGKPFHAMYYNSLILNAKNKVLVTYNPRRGIYQYRNDSSGSAISIEYPFQANKTYEIIVENYFHDRREVYDNVTSDGYPTLYVEMRESGIITGRENACGENSLCNFSTQSNAYIYRKKVSLDSPANMVRNFVYKFSPIESKNAILISLHPNINYSGVGAIPINMFNMALHKVIITELPFDPSINVGGGPRGS